MNLDRIVREQERAEITGLCRTTWWELEKEGRAPRRVALTGNRVGWRLSALQKWVRSRRPVEAE